MEFSHITLIVLQESPIVWEGNVGSIKPKKTVAVRCESNPINGFFFFNENVEKPTNRCRLSGRGCFIMGLPHEFQKQ